MAAPAPSHRGCLYLVVLALAVLVGLPAAVLLAMAGHLRQDESTPRAANDDDEPLDAGAFATPHVPERAPVDPSRFDAPAERAFGLSELCSDTPYPPGHPERRARYDLDYRGLGSAKRLRGAVAVVHVRLASPTLTWTRGGARDVDRSALMTARFVRASSEAHGVSDLTYTPIAWTLPTSFVLPKLLGDPAKRLSDASARDLVRGALRASEAALGGTLSTIATSLRKDGFTEVAFLLHLPADADARDFAFPATSPSEVDVAVVFQSSLEDLGYVTAHEAMHLFGADDLYPLDVFDAGDARDIMRARCRGLSGLRVGDMTAYAIGWRKDRPKRTYR